MALNIQKKVVGLLNQSHRIFLSLNADKLNRNEMDFGSEEGKILNVRGTYRQGAQINSPN